MCWFIEIIKSFKTPTNILTLDTLPNRNRSNDDNVNVNGNADDEYDDGHDEGGDDNDDDDGHDEGDDDGRDDDDDDNSTPFSIPSTCQLTDNVLGETAFNSTMIGPNAGGFDLSGASTRNLSEFGPCLLSLFEYTAARRKW